MKKGDINILYKGSLENVSSKNDVYNMRNNKYCGFIYFLWIDKN